MQRLRQMHRLDLLTPCQVRNGARQLQDTVIGPRRQIELRHAQHDVAALASQSNKRSLRSGHRSPIFMVWKAAST